MGESFFRLFLAGEARAQLLLPASFRDPGVRRAQVQLAAERCLAGGLLDVLRAQDAALPPSDARRRHLEALATRGTVAVVTGQQVGLFLGPLLTFYKAASAISAARALERETGIRCVPVFWLQTEDHDYPEIDHCHVLSPDGTRRRFALDDTLGLAGQRVSVEQRILADTTDALAQGLEDCLGALPCAGEALPLFRAHYRPGQMLAGAFAAVLAAIFSDDGLVVFDPRNPTVAKIAAPMYRRLLSDSDAIATALLEQTQALQQAGFDVQVHVRASSPLFFFHRDSAEGQRFRLERHESGYCLVGTDEVVEAQQLLRILESEPLRFSSSALLRPILQDHLFPAAAYVGGPAEVSYFAQLPPLYRIFQLPMPLIVPRARFRCIEARARALLDKLHLHPSDAERPSGDLRSMVASGSASDYPPPEVVRDRLMSDFYHRLDEFQAIAQLVDPGLLKPLGRTRATVERAASRLVGRYSRSLVERDRIAGERLERLQSLLAPEGIPQERYDSLPYFACKYGIAGFKEKVFASLDPFGGEVRDVQL
jgi:bacillithiol biosynthesis cysteine-adding enzyme BshC